MPIFRKSLRNPDFETHGPVFDYMNIALEHTNTIRSFTTIGDRTG